MGPLLLMGVSQIKGFQPGDADWGVKLDDVRGQAEAKEEIRRIVTLWQSGEVFEKAGGKRERGLLFNGAPGTGKTMMAKAIATGFNSPFITMPGSGFAQTFIGIDAIIVRFLAGKAKRLAKQVGRPVHRLHRRDRRRRHAPAGARRRRVVRPNVPDHIPTKERPQFYGPYGAVNPSGDMICESAEWREWMFRQRAPERRGPRTRAGISEVSQHRQPGHLPGHGRHGGGLALNQLLVDDGRRRQPAVLEELLDEPRQLVPRRDLHRAAPRPQALGLRRRDRLRDRRRVLLPQPAARRDRRSPIFAPLTAATAAWNIIIMFCGA